VRTVIEFTGTNFGHLVGEWECVSHVYASFLLQQGGADSAASKEVWETAHFHHLLTSVISPGVLRTKVALFAFFKTMQEAVDAEGALLAERDAFLLHLERNCSLPAPHVVWDPTYAWVADTTQDPFMFAPAGLRVDQLWYDLSGGARWVVEFTFTLGSNDTANALYLPRVTNNGSLAPPAYPAEVEKTFGIEHFPCGNELHDPLAPTTRTTSCCLPDFTRLYRPIAGFAAFVSGAQGPGGALEACPGVAPPSLWLPPTDFVAGFFPDMPLSQVNVSLVEPYAGVWKGRAVLDELELRAHAAMLEARPDGTSVLRTFLGFAHFSPTGPAPRPLTAPKEMQGVRAWLCATDNPRGGQAQRSSWTRLRRRPPSPSPGEPRAARPQRRSALHRLA